MALHREDVLLHERAGGRVHVRLHALDEAGVVGELAARLAVAVAGDRLAAVAGEEVLGAERADRAQHARGLRAGADRRPAVDVRVAEAQVRGRRAVDDVVVAARDDRAVERDERPRRERARVRLRGRPGRLVLVPLRRAAHGVDAVDEHRHAVVEALADLLGALDEVRVVGVQADEVQADVLALGEQRVERAVDVGPLDLALVEDVEAAGEVVQRVDRALDRRRDPPVLRPEHARQGRGLAADERRALGEVAQQGGAQERLAAGDREHLRVVVDREGVDEAQEHVRGRFLAREGRVRRAVRAAQRAAARERQ